MLGLTYLVLLHPISSEVNWRKLEITCRGSFEVGRKALDRFQARQFILLTNGDNAVVFEDSLSFRRWSWSGSRREVLVDLLVKPRSGEEVRLSMILTGAPDLASTLIDYTSRLLDTEPQVSVMLEDWKGALGPGQSKKFKVLTPARQTVALVSASSAKNALGFSRLTVWEDSSLHGLIFEMQVRDAGTATVPSRGEFELQGRRKYSSVVARMRRPSR